jgi:hypothetical protein
MDPMLIVILLLMLGYIAAEVNDLLSSRATMPNVNTSLQQIAAGFERSPVLVEIGIELAHIHATLGELNDAMQKIATSLAKIATELSDPVVGISPVPGTPSPIKGKVAMAAALKVTLVKKSQKPSAVAKRAVAKAAPVGFTIVDNEDCSFEVFGQDAAGNQIDISSVASLAVSSDTVSVLTVSTPTGMSAIMTAVGPAGTATLTLVATWNDGSVGPFTISWPITVQAGGVTGLTVVPGVPTIIS